MTSSSTSMERRKKGPRPLTDRTSLAKETHPIKKEGEENPKGRAIKNQIRGDVPSDRDGIAAATDLEVG